MIITLYFFNLLILFSFPAPGRHYGHSSFVGPIYQPTDPSTIPHRVEFPPDQFAR